MTQAAGVAAIEDDAYYKNNARLIAEAREDTAARLKALRFTVLPSKANFLFAASGRVGGEELYLRLKERGVLVRHFGKTRIRDYCRITIGTAEQMEILLDNINAILEQKGF
jgi:histidinol-phosphate aminotransferase